MNQVYELGYLILPSIPEETLPEIVMTLKEVITDAGANLIDGEDPVKIDLAYPMKKTVNTSSYVVNDAYLGWLKFESTAEDMKEVKEAVVKIEEVLRSILIRAPRETKFTLTKIEEVLISEPEAETEVVLE